MALLTRFCVEKLELELLGLPPLFAAFAIPGDVTAPTAIAAAAPAWPRNARRLDPR
jgi:hypothetical protein